jgi:hypothetical protein
MNPKMKIYRRGSFVFFEGFYKSCNFVERNLIVPLSDVRVNVTKSTNGLESFNFFILGSDTVIHRYVENEKFEEAFARLSDALSEENTPWEY